MLGHIVLLGDSIFDNRAYTGGEPDVVSHLRDVVPGGWNASLSALDGATIADLDAQLRSVPDDATHLVLSVGGNDALHNSDLLDAPVRSTAEALSFFAERVERFERGYSAGVKRVLALKKPTVICTIYNGHLDPSIAPIARMALMMFNDAILRIGFRHRLPIIDLRFVCANPKDYANPIEPSGTGGRKIAMAVARAVGAVPGPGVARVYAG